MKYAVALVIDASTEWQAFDGIADVLAKPHPWEGPVSAAFIGGPLEIADEEEDDSEQVAKHILAEGERDAGKRDEHALEDLCRPLELSPEARRVIGQLAAEGGDVDDVEAERKVWDEIQAAFPMREC